jgi:hypothetical protein
MQTTHRIDDEYFFRTYAAAKPDSRTWQEISQIAENEQEAHDLAQHTPHFSNSIHAPETFNSHS